MKTLRNLVWAFLSLLTNNRGEIEIAVPKEVKQKPRQQQEEQEDTEDAEGEVEEETEEDIEETDDSDDDTGDNVGKDRSKYIPRDRFDKVNAKAQKLEQLVEKGILIEDENGNLQLNPEVLRQKPSTREDAVSGDAKFRFSKDEVDDASWPLVEKINKAYDHYDELAGKMAYTLQSLQAENAILRDYPEFLQKEHPLRKKALDILKNDPEFKKTYRHNPERGYWAVKRAAELLANNGQQKKKIVNKSKFIVGRGDAGKATQRMVDMSSLSKDQLDELEKNEHARLMSMRKR